MCRGVATARPNRPAIGMTAINIKPHIGPRSAATVWGIFIHDNNGIEDVG